MRNNLFLDSFLDRYKQGELSKRELEGAIFDHILKNRGRFFLLDFSWDECADFLSWFYDRLGGVIDHYRQETGASFTTYMMSVIRYSARDYRRKEIEHRLIERVYWEAAAEDLSVHSAEPAYLEEREAGGEREAREFPVLGETVSNPKQVLILLLKSYNMLSDEFVLRAAPLLGIGGEELLHLVDELRSMRIEQDSHIRNFRERIYCQYYRCKTFMRRYHAAPEGSNRKALLQRRLERAEKRLKNMKDYYKTLKTGASNRQIAKLLGVPKGTVDSNLSAIKRNERDGDGEAPAPVRRRRPRR